MAWRSSSTVIAGVLAEYPAAGHAMIVELAQAARLLHETPPSRRWRHLEGVQSLIDEFRR